MQVMQEIQHSLAGLSVGAPQVHLSLALFRLLDERNIAPDCLLLEKALERKLARVTEVSADGRVPREQCRPFGARQRTERHPRGDTPRTLAAL